MLLIWGWTGVLEVIKTTRHAAKHRTLEAARGAKTVNGWFAIRLNFLLQYAFGHTRSRYLFKAAQPGCFYCFYHTFGLIPLLAQSGRDHNIFRDAVRNFIHFLQVILSRKQSVGNHNRQSRLKSPHLE